MGKNKIKKNPVFIVLATKNKKKELRFVVDGLKKNKTFLKKEKTYLVFSLKKNDPIIQTILNLKEFHPKNILFF